MSINQTIKNAFSVLLTITATGSLAATTAPANTTSHHMGHIKGMEQCFGISKAHFNDCSTALHDCAGKAMQDGQAAEWILLPEGLCNKIVNGTTHSPDEKKTR